MHNETIVVLSTDNPAFCSYLICSSILIFKMMGVTLLTIFHRMKNKRFISEEDAAWKDGQVGSNAIIDRVRRAYQNDLENIPLFLIISLCYLFTNVPLWLINTLFIIFILVRCLHTLVYAIYVVRQPTRAGLWLVGFLITAYMALHTVLYAFIVGYL